MLPAAASHPALPLFASMPLVDAALDEKPERMALATLPGLCEWARGILSSESVSLRTTYGQLAFEAAQAVAAGRPRPGHSVLGTFRDARPAWWAPDKHRTNTAMRCVVSPVPDSITE